ncbi:hypothetical protein [Halomarina oriensis]|uniref:MarR family transcriptional regulator n=1 Tax=Halomarina oriensis TaxID=671145 RepID=A0A6B0GL72_9EURY|nr:hypothetical protein [Halomarina oriensis]MWG35380.1 hypothetical protein [Halomarina oriensis]
MPRNDRTQLSAAATDALETIQEPIDRAEGLTREEAATVLTDDGFDAVDADVFLDELLSKGYLYAVNDELHVTPT